MVPRVAKAEFGQESLPGTSVSILHSQELILLLHSLLHIQRIGSGVSTAGRRH